MREKLIDVGVVASIFGAGWILEWASQGYAGVLLTFTGLGGWAAIRIFEARESREIHVRLKAAEDAVKEHQKLFDKIDGIFVKNHIEM